MALSTDQYGYLIDPLVPITDDKGTTIKDGFIRVYIAGSSTPVITYRNYDGAANEQTIELDNSGRCKYPIIVSKSLAYKVVVYDAQHSQETPIITVDKMFAIGASVTAGAGATVVTGLDGLTTKPDGFVDASVIGTDGYVALDHTLVDDELDTDAKVTAVENDRYIPLLNEDVNDPDSKMTLKRLKQWVHSDIFEEVNDLTEASDFNADDELLVVSPNSTRKMLWTTLANKVLGFIKSLSTTITSFRTGDVIPVDGPSGTAKMAKDDLLQLTAENALGSIHSLSDTATEADLVSGNYLALDGAGGTKKLPANAVAPKSQQDYIKTSLASAFDETKNYKANECVLYNGMYNRFLVDHPAGPWIGTDATGSKLDLNLLHRSRDNTDYFNGTKFILSSDGLYTASCSGEKIMTRLNGLRSEVPATIISYEYGYYMSSDGATKLTNSTFAILTLDVTGCDSVYVRGYTSSSSAQVVFQDTNNVKVGEYVRALSSGYNEANVDVPPDAVKVLISYSVWEGRTLDFKLFKNVPDFKMYNENYSEYKYIDVDWSEAGVYVFSDGSISTDGGANWKNSGKLPITGVEKIRITNRIVSGVLYAKFLDENDNEILPRQGGQNRTDNLLVVNVPANASSVILSVIDYVASGNHSIEFAYKKENEKTDNNGMNDCFVRNISDVTMIPIFGQSLSIGSASTPCLTTKPKYKAGIQFNTGIRKSQGAVSFFKEFMPLFEQNAGMTQDSAGIGETPASGCCEKILETIQQEDGISVHSELWGTKKILFVCCGSGSKTVADLTNDYLEGFLNAVQAAKNICDAHGNTFSVPCWLWIQGETDQKLETTKADYKSALISLQASIASGVRSITGQNYNPLCLLSQCAAQNIVLPLQISHPFNATALDVPTAQMELARDNSEFVFVLPNYILDHSSAEKIHLSNIGSRMMGLYFGVAAKHAMEGFADKSLVPTGASVSGNDITLSIQVPTPPLQVDESWVYAVANKGFAVVNSSNSDILTSVDVRADKIILHCSASPVGCRLFYGLNGTAFYDGREEGSRGNIRDCSGNIYSGFVAGSRICLHKYLPSFVMDIS